jgi:DNA polymerase-3 subunit delta'
MPPIPDIVGHEKQLGALLQDIAKRNVAHAYLFTGAPHLGKFTIARWFAWQLLADDGNPSQDAVIRDQIERLIHPDFLSLDALWMEGVQEDWAIIGLSSNVPQQHRMKKPAAKTDTISIEDVRLLQERLVTTGTSRHYCCLIRRIERMHAEAANAFLKILEEPPARVVFILTTENERSLLPTVVSRTRVVRFSPLQSDVLRPIIHGQDDDDAAFALHLAEGAPGKLVSLLTNPEVLRNAKQLHAQAKQFWQATTSLERLKWLMPFADKRDLLQEILPYLVATLREHPDLGRRAAWGKALTTLTDGLRTNAHRGLLLERFALAVSGETC